MTHADRRHTRYALPDGVFAVQQIKLKGMFGSLAGWGDCRLKDISCAGFLLMTSKRLTIGDKISVKLSEADGNSLTFQGNVVNASTDHSTGLLKIGVSISSPDQGDVEQGFLTSLSDRFKPVL